MAPPALLFPYFEPLGKQHNRAAFSCAKHPSLDTFLHTQALLEMIRLYSATRVLVASDGRTIIGYYSLSSTSVLLDRMPPKIVAKLPRYPGVPATLQARLAVDHRYQRQGKGPLLLVDALLEAYSAAVRSVASAAVIVDAIDDAAGGFYQRYGFVPFHDRPDQLFMPMREVRAFLRQAKLVP
jgi:GNAT superfamily N-acetyltransferase